MKKNVLKLFALCLIVGAVAIACDEDLFGDTSTDTGINETTVNDNTTAETNVARVFENVNNYGISEEGSGKKSAKLDDSTCVNVYWTDTTWTTDSTFVIEYPNTKIIDWAECSDGTIVGQLSLYYTEAWSETVGSKVVVTLVDYESDGVGIAGAMSIELAQLADTSGPVYNVDIDDVLAFSTDGNTASWGGSRTITITEGYDTDDVSDDVYSIGGSSTGTNQDGDPYAVEITEDMIQTPDCDYIVSGVMKITDYVGTDTTTLTVIDFGDGDCDCAVNVTVDGLGPYEVFTCE